MKKKYMAMSVAVMTAAMVLTVSVNRDDSYVVSGIAITPQTVEQTVSCVGMVEAVDGIPVLLPIDCYLKSVKVKVGQRVKQGDVLATLDRKSTGDNAEDPADLLVLAALENTITAPEDGVLVSVNAQSSQVLEKGTPCVVIARDEDIQVRIGIREKDLKQLKQGMTARIRGDGFTKESYDGELVSISSAARTEVEGGTIVEGVVALADGQVDPSLRLGLTAKVQVITSIHEDGLVIPYEAVLSDAEGDYVYVCENGKARVRRVNDYVRTSNGLMVSEESWNHVVVITAPEKIKDGVSVTVVEENQ